MVRHRTILVRPGNQARPRPGLQKAGPAAPSPHPHASSQAGILAPKSSAFGPLSCQPKLLGHKHTRTASFAGLAPRATPLGQKTKPSCGWEVLSPWPAAMFPNPCWALPFLLKAPNRALHPWHKPNIILGL